MPPFINNYIKNNYIKNTPLNSVILLAICERPCICWMVLVPKRGPDDLISVPSQPYDHSYFGPLLLAAVLGLVG